MPVSAPHSVTWSSIVWSLRMGVGVHCAPRPSVLDSRGLRDRIEHAFAVARRNGHASLSILELTEQIRVTWPRGQISHERMRDLGVHPWLVYRHVKNGPYRLVYQESVGWPFLVPTWQPVKP